MPNPDYLGAAADLEWRIKHPTAGALERTESMTLALSCVRAMQALSSHAVRFEPASFDGDVWGARDARGDWHYHNDPLTAITLALTEARDAE